MKGLHARWGNQVQFVDVIVRQAHPGPHVPRHHHFDEKMQDAQAYQRIEGIPWPVLVDDLAGTVHQVYGSLADPSYLIDSHGRVAFYNMWTNAPSLYQAIAALLAQGGHGVVNGGWDRHPHVGAAMTDGWRGLQRGLPQSFFDMELATPGSASGAWLGHQLRPVLAPLTLRSEPLPEPVRIVLTLGVALGALYLIQRVTRNA